MLRALEQIRRMRGGAQSHLMRCSDNYYYVVKFQNNPRHRRILAGALRLRWWKSRTNMRASGDSSPLPMKTYYAAFATNSKTSFPPTCEIGGRRWPVLRLWGRNSGSSLRIGTIRSQTDCSWRRRKGSTRMTWMPSLSGSAQSLLLRRARSSVSVLQAVRR